MEGALGQTHCPYVTGRACLQEPITMREGSSRCCGRVTKLASAARIEGKIAAHKMPVRLAVGSIVGGRTVRNIL